jgi:hypothetical protein
MAPTLVLLLLPPAVLLSLLASPPLVVLALRAAYIIRSLEPSRNKLPS